ncbi:MAG: virulence factor family protein, partial [Pseudomonas sp.]
MIRRNWRKWLAVVVVVIAGAAAVYWYMNRPAPAPLVEQVKLDDGNSATLVTPGTRIKARVVLSVPAEQALTDKQLTDLSKDGSAQLVQVLLAKSDCDEQENDLKAAAQHLDGPVTLFGGIGSGAAEAWSWLSKQTDDKATAVSVG